MKDIFKQLEQARTTDIVDRRWLAQNRVNLMAYIRSHTPVQKAPRAWFARSWLRMAPAVAFVAVILMVSAGGISLAAQNSIPGDFLYSWKVGVENVESAFVVGTQNRVDFEVHRTAKRLKEVTELAVKKDVADEVTTAAYTRLEAQVRVASAEITKVASEDNEKALESALELNSTLEAHQKVLNQLQPKVDTEAKVRIELAITSIAKTSEDVAGTVKDLAVKNTEEQKAKDTGALAEKTSHKLESAQKKLDEVWSRVMALDEEDPVRIEAQDKLTSAQDALTSAEDDRSGEDYENAVLNIQSGSELISQTVALLDAAHNAGSTVKGILAGTPVASITPSPKTSVTPTSTPTPTPSPIQIVRPTPTPSPTPEPKPVISLSLNKEVYVVGDVIAVTVTVTNLSPNPLPMVWTTGCQVDISIDKPTSAENRICPQEGSFMTLAGQQSHSWNIGKVTPILSGPHVVYVEVVGYGMASAPVTVIEP